MITNKKGELRIYSIFIREHKSPKAFLFPTLMGGAKKWQLRGKPVVSGAVKANLSTLFVLPADAVFLQNFRKQPFIQISGPKVGTFGCSERQGFKGEKVITW
jgi:hypothetical protein